MISITNDKKIKNFVKFLHEINQIIKNIYCDEVNFSPRYILNFSNNEVEMVYYNEDALPSLLYLMVDKEIIDKLFPICMSDYSKYFIVDSVKAFQLLKEKSNITKIEIDKNISFEINNETCIYNEDQSDSYNAYILNKYKDKIINKFNHKDEIIENLFDIEIEPDLIKEILDLKTFKEYFINEDGLYNTKQTDDDFKIMLSKKILNGAYYTIRKLKKGDTVEYSPINISVFSTDRTELEGIYCIEIYVHSKYGIVEHTFMISK